MNPYKSLAWTVGIHFFIMYALTFAAVHAFADIPLFSTRSLYMAVIMVAPMVILMVWFMRSMYTNRVYNLFLFGGSALLFLAFFTFIRLQTFVDNERFLQSMIPHHSSAITMCEEAAITDQEIIELCDTIIKAQQEEIDQMRTIQQRLTGN